MPIYEYICNRCSKCFEHLLRKPDEEIRCPYCQGKELKRKFSAFSFGTRDSAGNFKSSSKCASCTSQNCSSCA